MTPTQLSNSGTETGHQRAFFAQVALDIWAKRLPAYCELIYAIPNGGLRDPRTAAALKAEGVKTGVPDIFVPIPRNGFYGLYIELKRPASENAIGKRKRGYASDDQKSMVAKLVAMGYGANICVGWRAAYDTLLSYLGIQCTWEIT